MAATVMELIEERAEEIARLGPVNESLGRLDDRAAELLREIGVVRMLQPRAHGGLETTLVEFAEAVMRLASLDGSTGWVAGIVGVHPWELGICDPQAQKEVWGEDPDTWLASPYAPMGVITPVDGGYRFSGHWQFSSGTDHCQWLFLGAFLGDENGAPVVPRESYHVIIPRADYEIVDDSWNVVGLSGTGSKDVIVKDAFVPAHRVVTAASMMDGSAAKAADLDYTASRVPFSTAFPLGITSAVVGMAEGALAASMDYQRSRVQITGTQVRDDPYVLSTLGAAAEEIKAARVSLLENARRFEELAAAGHEFTLAERAASRRTQVAAAWRAVRAMNEIVVRSGGNGLRLDNPIQRFWRDAHMGLVHAVHVPGTVFHAAMLTDLGFTPEPGPLLTLI